MHTSIYRVCYFYSTNWSKNWNKAKRKKVWILYRNQRTFLNRVWGDHVSDWERDNDNSPRMFLKCTCSTLNISSPSKYSSTYFYFRFQNKETILTRCCNWMKQRMMPFPLGKMILNGKWILIIIACRHLRKQKASLTSLSMRLVNRFPKFDQRSTLVDLIFLEV